MPRRHHVVMVVLALAIAGACGESSGSGQATATAPPGVVTGNVTDPARPVDSLAPLTTVNPATPAVGPPETLARATAPPPARPVGADIDGAVVFTTAGGDDACAAGPGLPEGLVEGAAVTIRDASSGDVIGTGSVRATDFVPLPDQQWTCSFFITARVSGRPPTIALEIAGVTLRANLGPDGRFRLDVRTTDPPPDTSPPTAPPPTAPPPTAGENGSPTPTAGAGTAPPPDTDPPTT